MARELGLTNLFVYFREGQLPNKHKETCWYFTIFLGIEMYS
jgi:hypothetical protein